MNLPVYLPTLSVLSILLFVICVWCFGYSVKRIFGKEFPWYVNILGGALCAPFAVPVTIFVLALDLLGAPNPLVK